MSSVNVGLVGARGLVGSKILEIMEARNFPLDNLYLFGSENSRGQKISYKGQEIEVEVLDETSFKGKDLDIALFAAGGSVSEKYAPLFAKENIRVVDNSSFFRMDGDIKLIVPEINGDTITDEDMIIANPNCSTIQSVMALKPIYDAYGIEKIIYTTYQSVSGSGLGGLKDLEEGTTSTYPYQIQYNAIPHIDDFLENGYTKEEMKMVNETKKIFEDEDIKISATTVRIPVKYSHSIAINAKLEKDFKVQDIKDLIEESPGLVLEDRPEDKIYPMPINSEGKDEVFVGRIREDLAEDRGLVMFCTADNIRKGAALNAVQIAELLV